MDFVKITTLSTGSFLIGVASGLSFLRTKWETYSVDFFFWMSLVTSLLSLIFVGIAVWQYWENKSQIKKINAQVKVWMQDANGLQQALQRIVQDNIQGRYSSTNDMGNAVWAVEANTRALYQSLYEERCVTEDEYRERQNKISQLLDRRQFAELESEAVEAEKTINKTPPLPLTTNDEQ